MTTVLTATAVLCASQRTTGSAPSTAAAPQMALPVEVMRAVCLSSFSTRERATHDNGVDQDGIAADLGHLLEGEAEAVEHHACAQDGF